MIISVFTEIKHQWGGENDKFLGFPVTNQSFSLFFSRLEQNLIKSVPAGAFSAYKKLKRM